MSALLACGDGDRRDIDSGAGDGDRAPLDGRSGQSAIGGAADPAAGAPRTITLLTGDRVIVHADGRYSIDPGAGRRGIGFRSHVVRGHQFVVPDDAARLIAAGELDRRLFDVTLLLELGYDDANRADLPVIVTSRATDRLRRRPGMARSGTALAAGGARVVRQLPGLRGAAMRVPKRGAGAVWSALAGQVRRAQAADGRVWLDGKRKIVLDRSAPQIGAPAAWEAGYTGLGVTVAVLDSGIDAAHPDFAGRIVDARSFLEDDPDPADDVGHGTHVASIVAGSGAADGGLHRGIAPDAELLIGKVCDEGSCPDSAILAGLEWAAASGAAVVNLSFGGEDTPEVDPVEQAIDSLTAEHGTLFVAAAGNEGNCGGPDFLQVGSPSTADAALSVGAVDVEDELAEFSCRGPRIGDGAIKPDITAPGVDIVAARASGTELGDEDPVGEFYARISGTSMAAPHVTGAAALLAQQHPEWRAGELKAALMGSARPGPGAGVFDEGAGRVDLARAIDQSVIATPASLSLGRALWPHDDDAPTVRTVTYHNSGAATLTLQLAVEASGPGGAPAPGMFAVEPVALTIAAGGEAQVTLTVDTAVSGPDGLYSGALIATAGEQSARTPLAIDKEVESYDVDVTYLDRDGNPALGFSFLVSLEDGVVMDLGGAVGATSTRLPRGRYNLEALVILEAGEQEVSALFVQPVLDVSKATAVSLDARLAQPVDIRVPRPTARRQLEVVTYEHRTPDFRWSGQYTYFGNGDEDPGFVAIYTAHLGASSPDSELVSGIVSQWTEPNAPGSSQLFADSPYDYYLRLFPQPGRFPTGFVRHLQHRDLATVHAEYGAQASSSGAVLFPNGLATGIDAPPSQGATSVFRLPMSRTEYYTTENLIWATSLWETVDEIETFRIALPPITYRAGGHYRARWDAAVLGPGLRAPLGEPGRIVRIGDELRVSLESLYSDADGHAGGSFMATNQTRLYREDALIGESDEWLLATFEMPAEPGPYRLEIASQGGRSRLSTDVHVAWTFDSQRVTGPEPALLPIMTVEFAPRLDEYGRARAGRPLAIPLSIGRQAGAPTSPLTDLTVEASHDRGESWQEATLLRVGDCGLALIEHPDGTGTVSLRARAVAESGDTVEQTILDAYALR